MAQVSYLEKGYVDRPREDGVVQDRSVIVNLRNCLGELLQAADYLVNIAKPDEEAAIIAANLQSIVHDDDVWKGQVSALDICIRIVRDLTIIQKYLAEQATATSLRIGEVSMTKRDYPAER